VGTFVDSDELRIYLSQIEKYPILNREEESRLAALVRDKKDMNAAEKLITSNLRFVIKRTALEKLRGDYSRRQWIAV